MLPYHGECEDDKPIQAFIYRQQKILPTTQKLGCSFHYNHIYNILHLDLVYSMILEENMMANSVVPLSLCKKASPAPRTTISTILVLKLYMSGLEKTVAITLALVCSLTFL